MNTNLPIMSPLPDKVHDMLCSSEREMVQLGANLMTQYVKPEDWETVLQVYQSKTYCEGPNIYTLPTKRWRYKIEDGIINILPTYSGLWDQLDNGYKHTYSVQGFSLQLLETAYSEYIKNQQNGKTKTNTTRDSSE